MTPTPYPIPHDGPVGSAARGVGRSPMRAAHLHFMVTAPGFRTLVTHIFVRGDELLAADTVFGAKESLVRDFEQQPAGTPTPDGRDGRGHLGAHAVRRRPGTGWRLATRGAPPPSVTPWPSLITASTA